MGRALRRSSGFGETTQSWRRAGVELQKENKKLRQKAVQVRGCGCVRRGAETGTAEGDGGAFKKSGGRRQRCGRRDNFREAFDQTKRKNAFGGEVNRCRGLLLLKVLLHSYAHTVYLLLPYFVTVTPTLHSLSNPK